jgi:hypothetical protein
MPKPAWWLWKMTASVASFAATATAARFAEDAS